MRYFTKLLSLLKNEGILGTTKRILTSLRSRIMRIEDQKWEAENHISTVEIEDYSNGVADNSGFTYVPSYRRLIHTLIWNLIKHIDLSNYQLSDFTFIDYGSGKGQVLMTVAEFPFKEIIGIEYLTELHHKAKNNINIFQQSNPESPPIQLVNCDASEFDLPDTPCVIYFYNPFNEHIMWNVIRRIKESRENSSYPLIIIYAQLRDENPGHATNNIELINNSLSVRNHKIIYRSFLDKFLLDSHLISVTTLPAETK